MLNILLSKVFRFQFLFDFLKIDPRLFDIYEEESQNMLD